MSDPVQLAIVTGIITTIQIVLRIWSAAEHRETSRALGRNTETTDAVAEKVSTIGTQFNGNFVQWQAQMADMITKLEAKVISLETKLDFEREKATTLAAVKTEVPVAPVGDMK